MQERPVISQPDMKIGFTECSACGTKGGDTRFKLFSIKTSASTGQVVAFCKDCSETIALYLLASWGEVPLESPLDGKDRRELDFLRNRVKQLQQLITSQSHFIAIDLPQASKWKLEQMRLLAAAACELTGDDSLLIPTTGASIREE